MLSIVAIGLIAFIAIYTDIIYRKIFNYLTIPSIIIGFMLAVWSGESSVIFSSLVGFLVGLLILMPLFMLGGMGGGDVKLLAAFGALGGYPFIIWSVVYMAFIGGIFAFFSLLWERQVAESIREMKGFGSSIAILFYHPGTSINLPDGKIKASIPYGVAISLGAIIAMFVGF